MWMCLVWAFLSQFTCILYIFDVLPVFFHGCVPFLLGIQTRNPGGMVV